MTSKSISELRSEVIEVFIGIEGLVDCIIGAHYLGRLSLAFYHEVLYDEYFSFGLKVRILTKILSSEGNPAEKQIQLLRRLNNIRNIFAHCGITRYDAETKTSYIPNPKQPDEGLDFNALHTEFVDALPDLRDYLLAKAAERGANIRIKKNGAWEEVHA